MPENIVDVRNESPRLIDTRCEPMPAQLKKREWFKVTNLAGSKPAEIQLRGYIGASNKPQRDWWTGEMIEGEAGTVQEFQQALAAIGAPPEIKLYITSEGGNAWDAVAMHNMIARLPQSTRINCVIDGYAFSAATIVAMAADIIEMPQNALMMIHNAEWSVAGDKREMDKAVRSLQVMDVSIAKAYAGKSGRKPEDFLPLMEAETWMDGDAAKALGLADVVTAAQSITAHFDVTSFPAMPTNFRARFDTPTTPIPQPTNQVEPMLRPRTPLMNAAADPAAPAGGAAGTTPPPAAPAQPANTPTPPAHTAAAAAPPAAAPAQPAAAFTLADVTNAVAAAVKPLQDQLALQQTAITNLQSLHSGGAATAAQGAPPVSNAQPPAGDSNKPALPTNATPMQMFSFGFRQAAQNSATLPPPAPPSTAAK